MAITNPFAGPSVTGLYPQYNSPYVPSLYTANPYNFSASSWIPPGFVPNGGGDPGAPWPSNAASFIRDNGTLLLVGGVGLVVVVILAGKKK